MVITDLFLFRSCGIERQTPLLWLSRYFPHGFGLLTLCPSIGQAPGTAGLKRVSGGGGETVAWGGNRTRGVELSIPACPRAFRSVRDAARASGQRSRHSRGGQCLWEHFYAHLLCYSMPVRCIATHTIRGSSHTGKGREAEDLMKGHAHQLVPAWKGGQPGEQ